MEKIVPLREYNSRMSRDRKPPFRFDIGTIVNRLRKLPVSYGNQHDFPVAASGQ
jgi:hypothetical protein